MSVSSCKNDTRCTVKKVYFNVCFVNRICKPVKKPTSAITCFRNSNQVTLAVSHILKSSKYSAGRYILTDRSIKNGNVTIKYFMFCLLLRMIKDKGNSNKLALNLLTDIEKIYRMLLK